MIILFSLIRGFWGVGRKQGSFTRP